MWPIVEILIGTSFLLFTMMIHGVGMFVVMHRFERNWSNFLNEKRELRRQFYLGHLVILMLLTHLTEVLFIALVLWGVSAIPDFRTAFYFTGETYTTLGYGDVLLPTGWRQLALFIAMSGLFTFGWTTGVLVNIVGKTYEAQFAHLRIQNNKNSEA
jgi:hypothetical protein